MINFLIGFSTVQIIAAISVLVYNVFTQKWKNIRRMKIFLGVGLVTFIIAEVL